jgi:hypothetical protein
MDAIIMPSITSLVAKLTIDFPNVKFEPSREFRWSPTQKTIFFDQTSDDMGSLLHELSHAALQHSEYLKDIQLIEMERDAWHYAKVSLCTPYQVEIDDNDIQDALDTYRDWLHARSTCPRCQATGVQTKKYTYKCIACVSQWQVNDARVCALRRQAFARQT